MRGPANAGGAWAHVYFKLWGTILSLMLVLPVMVTPHFTVWVWDLFEAGVEVAMVLLLPLLAGLYALTLGRVQPPRVAGTVLLLFGVVFLVWAVVRGGMSLVQIGTLGGAGEASMLLASMGAIIGPVVAAAGNRVQRREPHAAGAARMAGFGGVIALLWLLIPAGDTIALAALFDNLGDSWPNLLWLIPWCITFGTAFTLFFRSPEDRVRVGGLVSTWLRITCWAMPVGIFVGLMLSGDLRGGGSGSLLFVIFRQFLGLFGFLLLVAVGTALVVERRSTPPEASGDVAEVF